MKTFTQEELKNILEKHLKWLCDEPGGERADLREANLYGANLSRANLYEANLCEANLYGANLSRADLRGANLYGANLSRANLYGADLSRADLSRADLRGAKNLHVPMSCPEEGSFIGFKKVRDNYIVKLYIPEDAKRSSATSRKCRCNKAVVLSITNIDGREAKVETVFSKYDENFGYTVGQIISVDDFDDNRWNECAPGIHFFITRQEAVEY